MKHLIFILMLLSLSFGEFKKKVIMEKIDQDSVVKFAIDNDILEKSNYLQDILIIDNQNNSIAYSIKNKEIKEENFSIFRPISYEREDIATITFKNDKKIAINSINIDIADVNFKTFVDILIKEEDKFIEIVTNYPIFDYTYEVGIRDFNVDLNKTYFSDEIILKYNTSNSKFFYGRLKEYERTNRYLKISKLRVYNKQQDLKIFNFTKIKPITKKDDFYIFKINYLPFSKIKVYSNDENFHKFGEMYISDDNITWKHYKNFSLLNSTFINNLNKEEIDLKREIKVNYIKIKSKTLPLDINHIEIASIKKEIFFIAKSNSSYEILYDLKNIQKYNPIDSIISKEDFKNATEANLTKEYKISTQKKFSFLEKIAQYKNTILSFILLISAGFLFFIVTKLIKN